MKLLHLGQLRENFRGIIVYVHWESDPVEVTIQRDDTSIMVDMEVFWAPSKGKVFWEQNNPLNDSTRSKKIESIFML